MTANSPLPDLSGLVADLHSVGLLLQELSKQGEDNIWRPCSHALPVIERSIEAIEALIAKVEALEGKGEGSARAESKCDGAHPIASDPPLSAGLTEPYRPAAIHHEAADVLEFVQRDVPTFAKPVQAGLDVLLTVDQREPIGWRIYGWSRIAPPAESAPSGAQRSELTPQAPDSPKSNEAEQ